LKTSDAVAGESTGGSPDFFFEAALVYAGD